jgi:replication-associated recombination protein RarA
MSSVKIVPEASASTIPVPTTIEKHSMPNFIVIGKSGSGKTSLATRLASELGCKLVNASTLSETLPNDETNEV